MQELKCPECGHPNPDIRELGYTLPWTCGNCPHIWRLQDLKPTMAEAVLHERGALLERKHSQGLTADEEERLYWLTCESRRLCPTVTPEMNAAVEALNARIDERQARLKTPNVRAKRATPEKEHDEHND
jgi:hypothetical protein